MSGMYFNREKYKHAQTTSTLYLDLWYETLTIACFKQSTVIEVQISPLVKYMLGWLACYIFNKKW